MISGQGQARRVLAVAGLALAALGLAPARSLALRVTVGTPTASFGVGMGLSSCSSCTQYQQTAPPGYQLTVPANGVITTWRVAGRGPLALRVLRPAGGGRVALSGSAPVSSVGLAATSIPTSVPVLAGDQIGLDLLPTKGNSAQARISLIAGSTVGQAQPAVAANAGVNAGSTLSGALNLNADVEVTPVAASLDVTSGPTAGGTALTITGSYLDGVTQVLFGGAPARFTLTAAGALLVKTPWRGAPGQVDVKVAGPGGTSTLYGAFTYIAPPPGPLPGGSPIRPGAPAGRAPGRLASLTGLALSPQAFRAAGRGVKGAGTRIAYLLSVAATIRFDVGQILPGRLVRGSGGQGRVCQPARHPVAAEARCSALRALTPGFSHRDGPGGHMIAFDGRLGGHALAPGSYRLRATATDAGGHRSASISRGFRILAAPGHGCPRRGRGGAPRHC